MGVNQAKDNSCLLKMVGITKDFPGVRAVDGVSLDLLPGEVHALVGENGAGKSTLMKVLCGIYQPEAGRILLRGQAVSFPNVVESQRAGISMIFQEFNLIPDLSVAENIFLTREPVQGPFRRVNWGKMRREAGELLARLGVQVSPSELVSRLSTAEKQMVEIAKALSLQASVLVMDEPTAMLTANEIERLFAIIGSLKQEGIGVIYISHRLDEVFRVADRVSVLRDGRNVSTRPVEEAGREQLIFDMVNRPLGEFYPEKRAPRDNVALEARNLSCRGKFSRISFQLRWGEILGLAGLVGAGRTDVARALFGLNRLDEGEILIEGRRVKMLGPGDAIRAGLGLVTEDRKEEGLFIDMSIARNVSMPRLAELGRFGLVSRPAERQAAQAEVRRLDIRPPDPEAVVESLSGGNQQKVVLGRWLGTKARILLLDEPTRGVDVGAKAEIYRIMNDFVRTGGAILLISSEMEEILGMCDRVLVMRGGGLMADLPGDRLTQQEILNYALGTAKEIA